MTLRFGLSESTIRQIHGVFSRFPQVAKAVLYGSRAKGTFKNGSDIDLTLMGEKDLNLDVLLRIRSAVDDLSIPYTVDLSLFSHISDTDVVDHIRRVGVVFYERVTTENP